MAGRRAVDWLQVALLLGTIITAAMRLEHRITLVEQRLSEADKDRQLMQHQLDRIERSGVRR